VESSPLGRNSVPLEDLSVTRIQLIVHGLSVSDDDDDDDDYYYYLYPIVRLTLLSAKPAVTFPELARSRVDHVPPVQIILLGAFS